MELTQWREAFRYIIEILETIIFVMFLLACILTLVRKWMEQSVYKEDFKNAFGFFPHQSENSEEWERLRIKTVLKDLIVPVLGDESDRLRGLAYTRSVFKLKDTLLAIIYYGYFTTRELEDLGEMWGYGWGWLVKVAPRTFDIYHDYIKTSSNKKSTSPKGLK